MPCAFLSGGKPGVRGVAWNIAPGILRRKKHGDSFEHPRKTHFALFATHRVQTDGDVAIEYLHLSEISLTRICLEAQGCCPLCMRDTLGILLYLCSTLDHLLYLFLHMLTASSSLFLSISVSGSLSHCISLSLYIYLLSLCICLCLSLPLSPPLSPLPLPPSLTLRFFANIRSQQCLPWSNVCLGPTPLARIERGNAWHFRGLERVRMK